MGNLRNHRDLICIQVPKSSISIVLRRNPIRMTSDLSSRAFRVRGTWKLGGYYCSCLCLRVAIKIILFKKIVRREQSIRTNQQTVMDEEVGKTYLILPQEPLSREGLTGARPHDSTVVGSSPTTSPTLRHRPGKSWPVIFTSGFVRSAPRTATSFSALNAATSMRVAVGSLS